MISCESFTRKNLKTCISTLFLVELASNVPELPEMCTYLNFVAIPFFGPEIGAPVVYHLLSLTVQMGTEGVM